MMFISNAKLSDEALKELREDADEEGRITKYKSTDESLDLEGSHGLSTIKKSYHSNRWKKICQKVDNDESEEDEKNFSNWQKDLEKTRIDLVRFLINQTKNATSPLTIKQLARDYKKEFKSSEPLKSIESRIKRFRQRIHEMNQFDKPTKIRMMFALSAPIDEKLLKELQKDANVEVDDNHRIKKYKAKDGSLELEGDHCPYAKVRAGWAERKKRRVVEGSSESEEKDENEEDSSESDESDEEKDGENVEESTKSKQTPTSSSARRSDRLQKSRLSSRNSNKKRQLSEKNSDSLHTLYNERMSRAKKRASISFSSLEASEDLEDPLNNEENLNDIPVERKPESLIDTNNSDDFDFDPSNYELDMDHLPIEKKPESLMEVEAGESSATFVENHYEENFFQYDQLNYVDDMEHMPEEKKPESLLEVKTEMPEEPSTSDIEYHYEQNMEHFPIEPKPEFIE